MTAIDIRFNCRKGVQQVEQNGNTLTINADEMMEGKLSISPNLGPFNIQEYDLPSHLLTEFQFRKNNKSYLYQNTICADSLFFSEQNQLKSSFPSFSPEQFTLTTLIDDRETISISIDGHQSFEIKLKYLSARFQFMMKTETLIVCCQFIGGNLAEWKTVYYQRDYSELLFLPAHKLHLLDGELEDVEYQDEDYVPITRVD